MLHGIDDRREVGVADLLQQLELELVTDHRGGSQDGFAVGAFVKHPSFGGGRILDREGSGKHLKLTIHFSEHGPKKILPAYTKLQVRVG